MKTIDLNRFYIIADNVASIPSDELMSQIKIERTLSITIGILSLAIGLIGILIEINDRKHETEK